MFTGHFAVAFMGKRAVPKLSLGTLVLACLLPDLLWCVFMVAGFERVSFKPGITVLPGMRALDVLDASEISYSHSLLMTAVWGALLALLYVSRRRNSRAAAVLFAVVLSHWVLDFISHPPDMQLVPGGDHPRFGLGLWNSIPATLAIEGAAWIGTIIIYLRIARPRGRLGTAAFWIGIAVVTAAWIGNIAGPPPPNLSTIGFSSFTFFSLTVGWAFWMNRTRSI